ncbi:MAG: energy transducer TonB [Nannocystaceae bacterium]|nr:energy transducer TonB [Nannocystaceae bacterium]
MFDTYMGAHAIDPGFRRRTSLALVAALCASALALGGYVAGERMSIRKVGAPHVELEFLLASTVPLPVASSPPPAPAAQQPEHAGASDPDEPTERIDDERAPDPDDVLERAPRPPRVASGPGPVGPGTGAGPVNLLGTPTGGMPCPIPGTCKPSRLPTAIPAAPRDSGSAKVPLSVVSSRLKYSPNPAQADLLRTEAGMARRNVRAVVEFCIDAAGKVEGVRTRKTSGDPEVDRLCREALSRWRFSALQVDGAGKRTCSEFTFEIAFE